MFLSLIRKIASVGKMEKKKKKKNNSIFWQISSFQVEFLS